MTETGTMQVTEHEDGSTTCTFDLTTLTEHEDGSTTCTFDLDDTTAALAQELGLKLLLYCGATGTSVDCVFKNILGEE